MNDISLDRVRAAWCRAARYPADKENHYPDHAAAQDFESAARKSVLEYGCGGGSDALSYLRRGAMVTYVDIVAGNVEAARARIEAAGLGASAKGIPLDESAKIPIPSGSVDIVNAHGVLHHIVDAVPVLQEFRRVLKPKGLLFCMLYTESLEAKFRDTIAKLVEEKGLSVTEAFAWCTDEEGAPYARSYTKRQGDEFLASGGFVTLSSVEYNKGEFRTFRARRK